MLITIAMKTILSVFFILLLCTAQARQASVPAYYKAKKKGRVYYISMDGQRSRVYQLGIMLDKAGKAWYLHQEDSLDLQPDGGFASTRFSLIPQNGQYQLLVPGKKEWRMTIKPEDPLVWHKDLNQGYYFRNYIEMTDQLNAVFPSQHTSFRGSFYTWDSLSDRSQDITVFRNRTDQQLRHIRDSISSANKVYQSVTDRLLNGMAVITYPELLEGIRQLPPQWAGTSKYFSQVVEAVSIHHPDYFFQLAKDMPEHQQLIFSSASGKKENRRRLRAANADPAIKRLYWKHK